MTDLGDALMNSGE